MFFFCKKGKPIAIIMAISPVCYEMGEGENGKIISLVFAKEKVPAFLR